MNIEIVVLVDGDRRTYTVYPEELRKIVCSKARTDNQTAKSIIVEDGYMKLNTWANNEGV